MDLRRAFIEDALSDTVTMTELCDTYRISRKTGYKMLARFESEGWAGLADRSRRPHTTPTAIPESVIAQLRRARQRKPTWGARKLRRWLTVSHRDIAWPSRAAIHGVLKREGLVRLARRPPAPVVGHAHRLRPATAPNDVWTIDFKGHFRLGSGVRCHPLTLRDLASRYTLRCDALVGERTAPTQHCLERAFAEYGLPDCIRSDNGEPFAGPGLARLSRLSVRWLRLGIAVEHIALGRPDQNGSHEQFHHVLKASTARPPARTFRDQQRRFDAFRAEYNHERPHEALNDEVPAQHYQPSPRALPRRLPECEYPGHWEPRRVSVSGIVSWRNRRLFLTSALAGELVAFEEIDDAVWTLHFGPVPLARWLERERRFRMLRAE